MTPTLGTDGKGILRRPGAEIQERKKSGARSPVRRLTPLALYAVLLSIAAGAAVVGLIVAGVPIAMQQDAWPLIGFAALAVLVERQSIPISPKLQVSVAFLPLAFVQVVFGPLAAVMIGAATILPEFPLPPDGRTASPKSDRPYLRWLVWTTNRVLVGALGGLTAWAALASIDSRPAAVAIATGAATTANFLIELTLSAITLRLRSAGGAREVFKAGGKIAAVGAPIYSAVAAIVAYAYLEFTPWSAVLFFVPAIAAQRLFVLWREQEDALRELAAANIKLESANLSFAIALVATLDARDRYTAGHSTAVAAYARDIAAEIGLSKPEQQLVHLCGLVHDIGKIGLPAGLLEKPGALTPDERRQMEEHSAIGERILKNVDDYAEIAVIVRHHHERVDGGGYPDRLTGDGIPRISRILAVADAYDAMTSNRPYRAAMSSGEARRRLVLGAGSQFDPKLVGAFETVLDHAGGHYVDGRYLGRVLAESGTAHKAAPAVALAS
jgi:putative nucleotidyltransferase with HDIG domain